MKITADKATNRVLVVDDDEMLVQEYVRCLGDDFEPAIASTTITDLEKALFGQSSEKNAAASFVVDTELQGEAGIAAVQAAIDEGCPYALVFLDINMPPGMDGIDAAKRIRALDPNINIVMVTGSMSPIPENLEDVIALIDKFDKRYGPIPENVRVYEDLYGIYCDIYDALDQNGVYSRLAGLQGAE